MISEFEEKQINDLQELTDIGNGVKIAGDSKNSFFYLNMRVLITGMMGLILRMQLLTINIVILGLRCYFFGWQRQYVI